MIVWWGALLISLCIARLMVSRHFITTRVVNLHLSLNSVGLVENSNKLLTDFKMWLEQLTDSLLVTPKSESLSVAIEMDCPNYSEACLSHTRWYSRCIYPSITLYLPVLHLVNTENPDGLWVPTHYSISGKLWLIARVWVSKYYLLPTYRLTA